MSDAQVLVGRYRLIRELGAGAMGTVWLAQDSTLKRQVAVKRVTDPLTPQLGKQAEMARLRAMREGRVAAKLSHPNAVGIYDVAIHEGEPWLVMEYVPSRTLTDIVQSHGPIPPQRAALLGTQIASALAEAHRVGIVHRDVKPSNLLLTEEGEAKLTDFGIARSGGDATLTASGLVTGTPAYFAPELARGADPTSASDVWSLGATLYFAVEGAPPFGSDDNPLVLLGRVANQPVPPPTRAGELTSTIMRLLHRDPTLRPNMVQARSMLAALSKGTETIPLALLQEELDTEQDDAAATTNEFRQVNEPLAAASAMTAMTSTSELAAVERNDADDVPDDTEPAELEPAERELANSEPGELDEAVTVVASAAYPGPVEDWHEPQQDVEASAPGADDDLEAENAGERSDDVEDDEEPDERATRLTPSPLAATDESTSRQDTAEEAEQPAVVRSEAPEPSEQPAPPEPPEPDPDPPAAGAQPTATRRRRRNLVLLVLILAVLGSFGTYLLAIAATSGGESGASQRADAGGNDSQNENPNPEEERRQGSDRSEDERGSNPQKQPNNTSSPTPTPTPSPTRTEARMTAPAMEQLVSQYYGLLPSNTDSAWSMLGPDLLSQGRDTYDWWWEQVASVQVSGLSADPSDSTVTLSVTFVMENGNTETERHQLGLVKSEDGERLLIDTDKRI